MSKKVLTIFVFVMLALSLAGYRVYRYYISRVPNKTEYQRLVVPVALQLYEMDFTGASDQSVKKYKILPANSVVWVAVNEWASHDDLGDLRKLKDYDGKDNIYVEEIIGKYLPGSVLDAHGPGRLMYYQIFPLSVYKEIPGEIKRCIAAYFHENDFQNTKEYQFTAIADRVSKVIAYGDFTGDNGKDMAVLLENKEKTGSKLVVFHVNENKECNVIFTTDLSGLFAINSFKKGSRVFVDDYNLEKAPLDGIIIKDKENKYAIIYDSEYKSFRQYYQYSDQEINELKHTQQEPEDGVTDTIESSY
ncbi:hypothetical protein [Pedobacter antarcticus]|uniref:hypothetical protein n=1 Tax=Pedobacter antarcticus TaxID=34086 RepID=UPI001C58D1FF|nr:hypothetical protein [Pedobacter antarcticus]